MQGLLTHSNQASVFVVQGTECFAAGTERDSASPVSLEFDTSSYILVCWGHGGRRKINHLRRLGLDIRGQRHRYMY